MFKQPQLLGLWRRVGRGAVAARAHARRCRRAATAWMRLPVKMPPQNLCAEAQAAVIAMFERRAWQGTLTLSATRSLSLSRKPMLVATCWSAGCCRWRGGAWGGGAPSDGSLAAAAQRAGDAVQQYAQSEGPPEYPMLWVSTWRRAKTTLRARATPASAGAAGMPGGKAEANDTCTREGVAACLCRPPLPMPPPPQCAEPPGGCLWCCWLASPSKLLRGPLPEACTKPTS